MREASKMGVSRRITAVPRDFVVGETWVLLGHRKAIEKACSECGDLPEGYHENSAGPRPGESAKETVERVVSTARAAGPDRTAPSARAPATSTCRGS